MDLAEAAGLLRCSPQYARRLLRSGRIAGTQQGRAWQVDVTSLANFMAQRSARPPGAGAPGVGAVPAPSRAGEVPAEQMSAVPASASSPSAPSAVPALSVPSVATTLAGREDVSARTVAELVAENQRLLGVVERLSATLEAALRR